MNNVNQHELINKTTSYLLADDDVYPRALLGLWSAEEDRSCDPLVISSSSCPASPPDDLLSSTLRCSGSTPLSRWPDNMFSSLASPVVDDNTGSSSPCGPLSPPGISMLWSHVNSNYSSYKSQLWSSKQWLPCWEDGHSDSVGCINPHLKTGKAKWKMQFF